MNAEKKTSDVVKNNKNRYSQQSFEREANKMRLDKEDTQRSNLNSKYLVVTLVVKYPDSFIFFYCVQ